MSKYLLRCLLCLLILSSCVSTGHQKAVNSGNRRSNNLMSPVTSSFSDVDTALIMQPKIPAGTLPVSLMELPRTESGAFVLSPGLYEADFKTYCLQPGTPGPSVRDVYFQAPLEGSRKDLIHTILFNSRQKSHLDQKNVQLLLWSVVSHSDFNKLSPEVQQTAMQLVSPSQLFRLRGGVIGVVKTVAAAMPSSGNSNDIKKLFEMSVRSYETYERLAVVNTPSVISRTDLTHEQWYQQQDGYFVRYLPNNYKQTRIQVYVPDSLANATRPEQGEYLIFDPSSWVVVPANSNAQRLGIGGPVLDIVRSVIRNIGSTRTNHPPKQPKSKTPIETGKEF